MNTEQQELEQSPCGRRRLAVVDLWARQLVPVVAGATTVRAGGGRATEEGGRSSGGLISNSLKGGRVFSQNYK